MGMCISRGLIPTQLRSLVSGLQSIGAPQPVTDWFLSCSLPACNTHDIEGYALVLRRLIDHKGNQISTCLEVRSQFIRKGLKKVLSGSASVNIDSVPIVIPKPYAPLFHFRKELHDYASDGSRSKEEKDHMHILIEFMNKNLQGVEGA
jgi:hypothetical protein